MATIDGSCRRTPRLAESHAMLVRKPGPEPVEAFYKTGDLSVGGCEFTSRGKLGVGSPLDITMTIDGRIFSAQARVVYERPKAWGGVSIGVEFTGLSRRQREMLISLMEIEGLACRLPDGQCPTEDGSLN